MLRILKKTLRDSRFRSSISSAVFVFFAIQTSLRAICIQITLFLSCEAPRIALRTPGGIQGTRVKCIHNSSLIFSHLSRTPLTNATTSLSLFAAAPPFLFLTRAKWQKRREREERALSDCKGRMRDSLDAEGIHISSTLHAVKTFNVLTRKISLMQLLSRKSACGKKEQNSKKCGNEIKLHL